MKRKGTKMKIMLATDLTEKILTSASKALRNFSMSKMDTEHMGQVNLQIRGG